MSRGNLTFTASPSTVTRPRLGHGGRAGRDRWGFASIPTETFGRLSVLWGRGQSCFVASLMLEASGRSMKTLS